MFAPGTASATGPSIPRWQSHPLAVFHTLWEREVRLGQCASAPPCSKRLRSAEENHGGASRAPQVLKGPPDSDLGPGQKISEYRQGHDDQALRAQQPQAPARRVANAPHAVQSRLSPPGLAELEARRRPETSTAWPDEDFCLAPRRPPRERASRTLGEKEVREEKDWRKAREWKEDVVETPAYAGALIGAEPKRP